jgi:hypothetical protein
MLVVMKIEIKDSRLLNEIQKEFNQEFPYLKIEFFESAHKPKEALPKSKMYASNRKIGTCRKIHNEGVITIDRNDSVAKFEQAMWDNFGLSVQVFRKSGNLWIETSLTDSWSLDRQNKEGLELSKHHNPYKDAEETDLTDRDKWE